MNEKSNKTAVEWLYEHLFPKQFDGYSNEEWDKIDKAFDQAKAMEKEYLERFYNQGYTQCSIEDLKPKSRERFVDAEDYYNKTFKSE